MKIDLSAILASPLSVTDGQALAHRISQRTVYLADYLISVDVQAGAEVDFMVRLAENPYLYSLMRANKANAAHVIEEVAGELREALTAAGVKVERIHAQVEPQGTNAHADTVFLTL